MISIITAIYNQLAMNRLYLDTIRRNTRGEWELIIVDNGSDDGSREFFETCGDPRVKVIANDGNYSYPYCQNKAIPKARGDVYAFFNNDILLSPGWDEKMLSILGKDGYDVLTLSSNDRMMTDAESHCVNRRYKRAKYPLLAVFGANRFALSAMASLTYGKWERYCEKVWKRHGLSLREGFCGSAVMMTRRAIDILGEWDPTMQGADFDLYLRTLRRYEEKGDIKPMSIVGGVVHHHYSRLTFRKKYPPFKDASNLRLLEEKWGDEISRLERLK